jgi:hypothetical protein
MSNEIVANRERVGLIILSYGDATRVGGAGKTFAVICLYGWRALARAGQVLCLVQSGRVRVWAAVWSSCRVSIRPSSSFEGDRAITLWPFSV